MRLTQGQARLLREMKTRARRDYLRHKLRTTLEIVGAVVLTAVFIAMIYGFMLVFPD